MNIKVKAVTSFSHGALNTNVGDEFELTKPEAAELQAAGLVSIVPTPAVEPDPQAEADRPDGGTKMAADTENKMADAPANKNSKAKAK